MIRHDTLASISDDDLFVAVQRLTARSNVALADLLAHLGEVERRGIHRLRACASLYTYCIYELRLSEDAAYRRAKAARLVREYPELHDAIAKGEIHLTGVLMIGSYLGGERHTEILRRARFRSKRELLRLIAEIDPKPEVAARVEPLGPAPVGRATYAKFIDSLSGPTRELPPGSADSAGEDGTADGADSGPEGGIADGADSGGAADAAEHARPLHYMVQFTATQEFVDLLEEAKDLLGHETPRATLPEIQVRALRALVQQLRTRKRAATKVRSPAPAHVSDVAPDAALARASAGTPDAALARRGSRYIPASVRRAVFERDGERCTYRDERGERCRETLGLEVHHRHAHALGGLTTLDNLELRCRAHNALTAEEDFGREQMDFARGVALDLRPGSTA